ncbi:MAG: hypothetical protein GY943_38425 [Chloroflexi bacterium]|nr:hypothetical protein [Chloroflexota bacterium]
MYSLLLTLHSLVRWFVLASLLFAIYRGYKGWLRDKPFLQIDNTVRQITATIAYTQLIIGLWLYFISPVIDYFLKNYQEAVNQREFRFFGMEHGPTMIVAILIIVIGSTLAKRRVTDNEKFKTMAIWFSIALVMILLVIPWPFSPMAGRPYLRPF